MATHADPRWSPDVPFCGFCGCECCRTGEGWKPLQVTHAPTDDGRWICEVCYSYDLCTSGPDRNPGGPCEDGACRHRPTLVGPWRKRDVP